ncbi:hypothetical protein Vadar_023813 [Vaccinium darrowii]|nr:hypothetical protein Vadar_023813 [Vaccinium darrowii]
MNSDMSSANSRNSRPCGCGSGPCIITTSRSSKNPGRRYYKCPRVPPCGTWNGWCEESSPRTSSLAQPNDGNGTASAIATLHDDVAYLRAENREILSSLRTLKTIIFAQNELVAKFRERPLDHEDLMQRVFESVTAIGKFVYKEGQPRRIEPKPTDDDDVNLDDLGDEEGPVMGDADFAGIETGEEMGTEPSQAAAATPSQRRAMPKNPGLGGNSSAESSKRKIPSCGNSKEGNGSANRNNLLDFGSFAGWLNDNNLSDPQYGHAVLGFGFNEYGGEYNNNPYHSQLYGSTINENEFPTGSHDHQPTNLPVDTIFPEGYQHTSWERNTYTGEAHTSSLHGGTSIGPEGGHGQSTPTNIHVGSSAGGLSGPTFDTYGGTSGGAWGGHGQSPPPSHGSRQYDNWEAYVQRSWDEGYGYGTDDHLEDEDDRFSLPADDTNDREDESSPLAGEEEIEWEADLHEEEDYETLRSMAVFCALHEQMDQGKKKKRYPSTRAHSKGRST